MIDALVFFVQAFLIFTGISIVGGFLQWLWNRYMK